jgi:hypothetical protein
MRTNVNPYPNPYGVTFENEPTVRKNEQVRYKEDLDYLVNLRRRMKEDESSFRHRDVDELNRRVQVMNEQHKHKAIDDKNLMKGLKYEYASEMQDHKDKLYNRVIFFIIIFIEAK